MDRKFYEKSVCTNIVYDMYIHIMYLREQVSNKERFKDETVSGRKDCRDVGYGKGFFPIQMKDSWNWSFMQLLKGSCFHNQFRQGWMNGLRKTTETNCLKIKKKIYY